MRRNVETKIQMPESLRLVHHWFSRCLQRLSKRQDVVWFQTKRNRKEASVSDRNVWCPCSFCWVRVRKETIDGIEWVVYLPSILLFFLFIHTGKSNLILSFFPRSTAQEQKQNHQKSATRKRLLACSSASEDISVVWFCCWKKNFKETSISLTSSETFSEPEVLKMQKTVISSIAAESILSDQSVP